MKVDGGNFEIGRILHLKSEIRNLRLDWTPSAAGSPFEISAFGFEMQDLSNFKFRQKIHCV